MRPMQFNIKQKACLFENFCFLSWKNIFWSGPGLLLEQKKVIPTYIEISTIKASISNENQEVKLRKTFYNL